MRAAASAALLALLGGSAAAECRQALALGLDVSGSVDGTEYAFQRDGLALALESPAVAETLLAAPEVLRTRQRQAPRRIGSPVPQRPPVPQ